MFILYKNRIESQVSQELFDRANGNENILRNVIASHVRHRNKSADVGGKIITAQNS